MIFKITLQQDFLYKEYIIYEQHLSVQTEVNNGSLESLLSLLFQVIPSLKMMIALSLRKYILNCFHYQPCFHTLELMLNFSEMFYW